MEPNKEKIYFTGKGPFSKLNKFTTRLKMAEYAKTLSNVDDMCEIEDLIYKGVRRNDA